MQTRILLKCSLVVGVVILFSSTVIFLTINFSASNSFTKSASLINSQILPRPGLPIRLKIPKINVDTTVESVGLMSDGTMGVPKGPTNAAWFNLGPRPGEKGSAVIDGHSGHWKNGAPTVFNNLYKLIKGDKVYVEDNMGETVAFVVRDSREYDPEADASDVFGSSDGKAHLNLITCEGTWDKAQKTYSNRLVVFTDKVY